MLGGLYLSANGMRMQERRQGVIANNLANVNTVGFKKNLFTVKQMETENQIRGRMSSGERNSTLDRTGGVLIDSTRTLHTQGTLEHTNNDLDFALNGPGFFKVKDQESGDVFYTRNGNFGLNDKGELVMSGTDLKVMSNSDAPILLTPEMVESDVIKLVSFSDIQKMNKVGNNLYVGPGEDKEMPVDLGTKISKGFLEGSNTESIDEMVKMIEAHRVYQANAKNLSTQDENIGKLIGITRF